MAELRIDFTRHDNLANFDAILASVAIPEITSLCEVGVGFAQENSPVDMGFYRAGFTNEVTELAPGQIQGVIYNTSNPIVVNVIENGRKPGRFPPVDVIRAWVMRKLGVAANLAPRVAYLVGRKIATFGIPGHFIFKQTEEVLQPLVERAGVRVSEKIAARL